MKFKSARHSKVLLVSSVMIVFVLLTNASVSAAQSLEQNRPPSRVFPWTVEFTVTHANDLDPTHQGENLTQSSTSYQLKDLIWSALENHPVLNAGIARMNAVQQEMLQAGLAPNPKLGLFADEVGNDDDPGLWGIFLQRQIVRGNKLGLAQNAKAKEIRIHESKLQSLALKVETDVKSAYYRIVIAQRRIEYVQKLVENQLEVAKQTSLLFDNGEVPRTDLLQAQIQLKKSETLLRQAQVSEKNLWLQLAISCNRPKLPATELRTSLDEIVADVTFDECLQKILEASPEMVQASEKIELAQAELDRELARVVPDYQQQLTVGKDSSTEHFYVGAQLQVPLMVGNRNQGNIGAARYRIVEATNNLKTVELRIRQKLAVGYKNYQAALIATQFYQSDLIPQAGENLDLLSRGYPEEVGFLQLLTAQQNVVQLTLDYLDSLEELWMTRVKIEGLTLQGALGE